MVLLFGLLILAILAVFAIENWAPVVPLVLFGAQTAALPMALWVIGALLAGALTVLLVAVLLQLLTPRSPSGRRPWDAARYADEEQMRQRYVEDDTLDGGGYSGGVSRGSKTGPQGRSRWGKRTNPYVDDASELDDPDDGDDYGNDDGDENRDPVYRPFSNGSVSSTASRSPRQAQGKTQDSWDSFSQPRQDWADFGSDRRQSDRQQNNRYQPEPPPYRASSRDVDVVVEVDPIDVAPSRDGRDGRGGVGGEEDWNDWSGYEEPAPSERPIAERSPIGYSDEYSQRDEPRSAYEEETYSNERYADERHTDERYADEHYVDDGYTSDQYANTAEPDEVVGEESYDSDSAPPEPLYEPPYNDGSYDNGDRQYRDDSPDSDSDYEDYIVDYGDEAEIDQFDVAAARRGGAAQPNPAAGVDPVADGDDADDAEGWNNWDDDEPTDAPTPPETAPPRDIYEVPAEPKAVSRSGSIYTYSYRDSASEDGPEDPVADNSTTAEDSSPEANDDDADSPDRTLIPPYRPDDASPDATP
ncbi:MAG: hypothetical protein WBA10_10440 [Elainellaceae cyanobacterium]